MRTCLIWARYWTVGICLYFVFLSILILTTKPAAGCHENYPAVKYTDPHLNKVETIFNTQISCRFEPSCFRLLPVWKLCVKQTAYKQKFKSTNNFRWCPMSHSLHGGSTLFARLQHSPTSSFPAPSLRRADIFTFCIDMHVPRTCEILMANFNRAAWPIDTWAKEHSWSRTFEYAPSSCSYWWSRLPTSTSVRNNTGDRGPSLFGHDPNIP